MTSYCGNYIPRGYIVKRRTSKEIGLEALEQYLFLLEKSCQLFDIEKIIDLLSLKGVTVCIESDKKWGEKHTWLKKGESIPGKRVISIPMKVFNGAKDGKFDDIKTFFHELGHVALQHDPIYFRAEIGAITHLDDAEEQADLFAEFMMTFFEVPDDFRQMRLFP